MQPRPQTTPLNSQLLQFTNPKLIYIYDCSLTSYSKKTANLRLTIPSDYNQRKPKGCKAQTTHLMPEALTDDWYCQGSEPKSSITTSLVYVTAM